MHSRPSGRVTLLYAVAFAYLVGKAALFRERVPPGVPPDERAHVSYVAYVEDSGRFVPRYEEMRLLDEEGRFGPQPSYLPHPPCYYAALGGIERLGGGSRSAPFDLFTRRLRRVTAPLFAAAAALFLLLGWRRTAPFAEHLVFAAAIATVPPLAFVGSAVNSDLLAFLAGGLALLGLARWLEGRSDALTGTLVGAGLSFALLAKLTCGLLVGFAVLGTVVASWRSAFRERSRRVALWVLPWLILPALHYVPVLLRYGTPIPTLEVTHPGAIVHSPFLAGPPGDPGTIVTWGRMLARIASPTWFSIVGHVGLPNGRAWTLAGPALLLALAAFGLVAPGRSGPEDDQAGRTLARIGAGAVAATLLLNLLWSWAGYRGTGRIGGIHARYYLPLLPCLGLAAAAAFRRLRFATLPAALLAALLLLADLGVTVRYLALLER